MYFFTEGLAETTAAVEIDNDTNMAVIDAKDSLSSLINFVPLIIIFIIFYFLIIRPQQKKMKAHEKMISSIKRGDKISTTGGIIGSVTYVDDKAMQLKLKVTENVEIKMVKSSVAEIINRSKNGKD